MREIGVERESVANGECHRRAVEGTINAGVVVDWLLGHSRHQLVDEANALGGTQRVAISVSIVFPQRLIIVVLMPFVLGEQSAKRRELTGDGCNRLEGTNIHDVNCLGDAQICAREVGIQPGLYRGHKDILPSLLGVATNRGFGPVFKILA